MGSGLRAVPYISYDIRFLKEVKINKRAEATPLVLPMTKVTASGQTSPLLKTLYHRKKMKTIIAAWDMRRIYKHPRKQHWDSGFLIKKGAIYFI